MIAFDCAHEKKHGVKDPGAMNIEREREGVHTYRRMISGRKGGGLF